MAAAGVDEVGCFSLARAMLPLPLSDVIRDRNSAHLRKRGRPPLGHVRVDGNEHAQTDRETSAFCGLMKSNVWLLKWCGCKPL